MNDRPKFNDYMRQAAAQRDLEKPISRYGLVSAYDPTDNTATVILTAPDGDVVQQILSRVPCPVYPGIQQAAPGPGIMCFVVFLSPRNEARPIITHFFNHEYRKRDYYRHNDARSGVSQFHLNR